MTLLRRPVSLATPALDDPPDLPVVVPLTRVPLSDAPLPPVDAGQPPWPSRLVEVGGLALNVRSAPGPAVGGDTAVYLHGLGGSSMNWTDLSNQLSTRMCGLALDLPGFGRSRPPRSFPFTLEAHAEVAGEFVRKVVDERGSPVHLFGNSLGGAIAILVAAAQPELVASLTLISPAVPDLRPDPRRVSDVRVPLALLPWVGPHWRRQLAEMPAEERVTRMLRLCFFDPDGPVTRRLPEYIDEYEARRQMPWAAPAMGSSAVSLLRTWFEAGARSLWQVLPRVPVPSLVIWGADDRLVTVRKGPRTAALLPRGRLLVLPRTGHVAQMERPQSVARAVLGMLDAINAGEW